MDGQDWLVGSIKGHIWYLAMPLSYSLYVRMMELGSDLYQISQDFEDMGTKFYFSLYEICHKLGIFFKQNFQIFWVEFLKFLITLGTMSRAHTFHMVIKMLIIFIQGG